MTDLSPLVGMTPGRKVRPLPTRGGGHGHLAKGEGQRKGSASLQPGGEGGLRL